MPHHHPLPVADDATTAESRRRLIAAAPALLLLLLAGLATAEPPLKIADNYPGYESFGPSLIINLASDGESKFLRVEIQYYVLTAQDADVIRQFQPVLRDRLISLYGGRDMDILQAAEGREALRKETLADLRETLLKFAGRPAIEDLYFTGFVMQ